MVEDVVGVGRGVVVADDAGVLRLASLVHVATHREPRGAVVLLVLYLVSEQGSKQAVKKERKYEYRYQDL